MALYKFDFMLCYGTQVSITVDTFACSYGSILLVLHFTIRNISLGVIEDMFLALKMIENIGLSASPSIAFVLALVSNLWHWIWPWS